MAKHTPTPPKHPNKQTITKSVILNSFHQHLKSAQHQFTPHRHPVKNVPMTIFLLYNFHIFCKFRLLVRKLKLLNLILTCIFFRYILSNYHVHHTSTAQCNSSRQVGVSRIQGGEESW